MLIPATYHGILPLAPDVAIGHGRDQLLQFVVRRLHHAVIPGQRLLWKYPLLDELPLHTSDVDATEVALRRARGSRGAQSSGEPLVEEVGLHAHERHDVARNALAQSDNGNPRQTLRQQGTQRDVDKAFFKAVFRRHAAELVRKIAMPVLLAEGDGNRVREGAVSHDVHAGDGIVGDYPASLAAVNELLDVPGVGAPARERKPKSQRSQASESLTSPKSVLPAPRPSRWGACPAL